ncbi:MAG: hypothetical protein IT435_05795 [Phycisphaerales bacterium]|nr:hypothetical protein [Phycisphaerales bacterium]
MFTRVSFTAAAVVLCAYTDSSLGQCTPTESHFCVTTGSKTVNNPNQGGFPQAWYINSIEAKVVTLVRGRTYTFKLNNVSPIHAFYISTNEIGSGTGIWSDGVSHPGGVTGNATLTFAVPFGAPDLLYYQCDIHDRMGWKITILCPSDFDQSGFVDTDDFDAFVEAFIEGIPEADFDQSGFVDTDDYDAFVLAFEAGC